MSRQGYLVLHEKRDTPKVYFFSLEDGYLRYYKSAECTKAIGEVRLSGCKIVVKAQKRTDGVPNSFFLETRKVFVKDRSYTLGNPIRLELTAYSNEDRQEWGKVLFSWQRYYWRDPSSEDQNDGVDHMYTKSQCEQVLHRFYPKAAAAINNQNSEHSENLTCSSPASVAMSVAKQPFTFLRRNASSLRRSFSMYMPSSTSTTSTTSTASSAASSKSKTDIASSGPEVADCEKDKVVLAKVAYGPETIYRGNNQEEPTRV